MKNNTLSIIIPTKDRPSELERLLGSVMDQEVKPLQIVIVDGGNQPVDGMIQKFPALPLRYVRKIPPSLTAQRNAGIGALHAEATIVSFVDDDIVFQKDAIRNIMRFWDEAPDTVGGAAFNLINEKYKKPSLFEKMFMVNTYSPSRILRSGFQGKVACVDTTIKADWLVGCAMTFRRKVFDDFSFDEYFSGYARYEDVDFTYRVGKKYRMYVVSDARVLHLNQLEDPSFSFRLGRMEALNRVYFVKKHKELSLGLCYWALFGILMNNIIRGVLGCNGRYLNRAGGNISGLFASAVRV